MGPNTRLLVSLLCSLLAAALQGCATPSGASAERMVGVLGSPDQARSPAERKDAPPVAATVPAGNGTSPQIAESQARLRAAEEAYARGDWILAAREFKALTRAYPRNPQIWFGMGAAAALSGDLDDASTAFESALRIDTRDARAAYNLSLIRLSQAEVALGTATANSALAPAPVQVEILRLSKELAPVFRRSGDSVPAAAAPPVSLRRPDPARTGAPATTAGPYSATPLIPAATASR